MIVYGSGSTKYYVKRINTIPLLISTHLLNAEDFFFSNPNNCGSGSLNLIKKVFKIKFISISQCYGLQTRTRMTWRCGRWLWALPPTSTSSTTSASASRRYLTSGETCKSQAHIFSCLTFIIFHVDNLVNWFSKHVPNF